MRALRGEIAHSSRVRGLLAERDRRGEIPFSPYAKWYGAHWVLVMLAELAYPPGDTALVPLRDQVLDWLTSREYDRWIRRVKGIPRIHASIDGNAVWCLHALGQADARVDLLVTRLLETQWADGGWNCDVKASGRTSSFTESLIPLRALALHAQVTGDVRSRRAADRAAEFFLERHLFRRKRNRRIIRSSFVQLHYPCYWHYDILFGLKVMTEGGWIGDARCAMALDLLETKRVPGGGWPAEARYYRHTRAQVPAQRSLVAWGPTGKTKRNDFVTVDALMVLRAAGRFKPG
jgi:hypothetical protein